jgi:hypothetical protein
MRRWIPLFLAIVLFMACKGNAQGVRSIVKQKSDVQASSGRMFHPGGPLNGREGVGVGSTRLSAILNACGPALFRARAATRGSDGRWYATTQTRRLFLRR